MNAAKAWIIDAGTLDLALVVVWSGFTVANILVGEGTTALLCAVIASGWLTVTNLRVQRARCPLGHGPVPINSSVVAAAIEPSADIRQGVHAVAEMRVALLAEGYTPAQASRQIADIIAATNNGGAA